MLTTNLLGNRVRYVDSRGNERFSEVVAVFSNKYSTNNLNAYQVAVSDEETGSLIIKDLVNIRKV